MIRLSEKSREELREMLGCAGTLSIILLLLWAMMIVEPEGPRILIGNATVHTLLVRVGDNDAVSVRPSKNVIVYYELDTSIRVRIEVCYAPRQGVMGSAERTIEIASRGTEASYWIVVGGDHYNVLSEKSSQYIWVVHPSDLKAAPLVQ